MPCFDRSKNKCEISGIIKNNGGNYYGFNMRFQTPQLAQHYKEMIIYILKSDELKLNIRKAIYDEKGE